MGLIEHTFSIEQGELDLTIGFKTGHLNCLLLLSKVFKVAVDEMSVFLELFADGRPSKMNKGLFFWPWLLKLPSSSQLNA